MSVLSELRRETCDKCHATGWPAKIPTRKVHVRDIETDKPLVPAEYVTERVPGPYGPCATCETSASVRDLLGLKD
jgi:hypothetical protein